MSKDTKKKLVPELRFPEFDGEWVENEFGDLLIDFRLGGNYSNSETPNNFPLIKMGNIDRGNIKLDKVEYIEKNEIINEIDKIKEGDLFFNTRNTLELVGKVAIWRNELPIAYYNSNLMYIKFENNYFMNYKLNSIQGIKELKRLATGTTSVAAIYTKDLLKIKFNIPQLPEQQKIASFLSKVDEKIALLTKNVELLEQYKKGVTQKILKQEIRFKDEQGNEFPEWQRKALSSFLIPTIREIEKPNKNYLAIGVRSHCKGTFQKPDSDPNENSMDKLYQVMPNDLIVNITFAWEGAIAIVRDEDEGGLVSHRFPTYIFDDKVCIGNFFKFVFVQKDFKHQLDLISPGGAGRNRVLSKGAFLKLKCILPCVAEQTKIANLLQTIDKKLELVKLQLKQTKQWKKGLLQKMFV